MEDVEVQQTLAESPLERRLARISIALIIFIAAAWGISYFRIDVVRGNFGGELSWVLIHSEGELTLGVERQGNGSAGWLNHRSGDPSGPDGYGAFNIIGDRPSDGWAVPGMFYGGVSDVNHPESRPAWVMSISHWLLLLVVSIVPTSLAVQHYRARRKLQTGACIRCGYDLRATPDRCPECGLLVTAQPSIVGTESNSSAHRVRLTLGWLNLTVASLGIIAYGMATKLVMDQSARFRAEAARIDPIVAKADSDEASYRAHEEYLSAHPPRGLTEQEAHRVIDQIDLLIDPLNPSETKTLIEELTAEGQWLIDAAIPVSTSRDGATTYQYLAAHRMNDGSLWLDFYYRANAAAPPAHCVLLFTVAGQLNYYQIDCPAGRWSGSLVQGQWQRSGRYSSFRRPNDSDHQDQQAIRNVVNACKLGTYAAGANLALSIFLLVAATATLQRLRFAVAWQMLWAVLKLPAVAFGVYALTLDARDRFHPYAIIAPIVLLTSVAVVYPIMVLIAARSAREP